MATFEVDIVLETPTDPDMAEMMDVTILMPYKFANIAGSRCTYGKRCDATLREYLNRLYELYVSTFSPALRAEKKNIPIL